MTKQKQTTVLEPHCKKKQRDPTEDDSSYSLQNVGMTKLISGTTAEDPGKLPTTHNDFHSNNEAATNASLVISIYKNLAIINNSNS